MGFTTRDRAIIVAVFGIAGAIVLRDLLIDNVADLAAVVVYIVFSTVVILSVRTKKEDEKKYVPGTLR